MLKVIGDLPRLDKSAYNPSEQITYHALSLLGTMFEHLLNPFIDPDMSLSQQLTGLITFAHISCALFRRHENAFMPHHLYSDLQCMVRTAVFRIAHSKLLDPQCKVFLCLLGDDVLEVLFGRTRMIGGHSPNYDVEELRRRIGEIGRAHV